MKIKTKMPFWKLLGEKRTTNVGSIIEDQSDTSLRH